MPRSTNPNSYKDIQLLCDIALTEGECTWSAVKAGVPKSRATSINQRFFFFRKLMNDIDPNSPYVALQSSKNVGEGTVTIYEMQQSLVDGITTEYDPTTITSSNISVEQSEDNPLDLVRNLLDKPDIV